MAWSFQIGNVFGIPLRLHITFLLLLLLIAFSPGDRFGGGGLLGVLFVVVLFACVVIHELSHSLVARRYGIPVREIVLLPIGGVAMMERMPDDPRQELHVAIAGPAASIAVAIVLGAVAFSLYGGGPLLHPMQQSLSSFLGRIAWVNILLALFNLLPAFPADGGRVLRSLLAMRMDYARATHVAATVGQAFAIILGFLGLFMNLWWLLIAVFLFLGATSEDTQVQLRSALAGVPARAAMVSEFRSLDKDETLYEAFAHASRSYQHDFPVTDDGRLVGLVTRQALISGMHELGGDATVAEVMLKGPCAVGPEESLAQLYDRIAGGSCPVAAVMAGDTLLGLVTPDSVNQYLMAVSIQPPGKR
ncbi:MAG: site-2 protease family protein [Armatimonadetes bacterium]|nr:site-2 protease family protein [Armatimonadota bacterium]